MPIAEPNELLLEVSAVGLCGSDRHQYLEGKTHVDNDVLDTIQGMVASCVFPLAPPPPAPNNIAVHADANSIPKDTTNKNGWNYVGTCSSTQTTPCSIQVYGSWCDRIMAKEFQDVQALYGCPNGPPVP